ncbi:GRAM domain-containing protein [Dictyostelium discoideum AX4]|uniref:Synaptosomal-associated protein 47 n=1 Tax=Dictyostelium discoideum TaxID=44689 RepID=Q55GN5_DICDI|nr:GRAM domain-containing protein [Dictyostelium discoideum AX4]EAL73248.1 GRAM domain-containing protein [Dictyostelium discoideum AX4]|eukprot:XP_647149.1 GRAM domain-containing protein [Dictyostelium discoideum AX4]
MTSPADKANHLKVKTELVRRTFNYPETENVIQDYSCALNKVTLGKMYITENFLSFIASIGSTTETIPLRKILEMKKDTTLFVNNAITFKTAEQLVSFGTFSHRDEAFTLIYHLWKCPPFIYNPNSVDKDLDEKNLFRGAGQQKQKQLSSRVDTQSTKLALKLATETKETGIATLNELSYQAEVIDGIEAKMDNIHANLDRSDRLLKGIESVGGALSNHFSKDTTNGPRKEFAPLDRSLQVRPRDEPPIEIDILEKLANDSLIPGFVQIHNDRFIILDANRKPRTEIISTYTFDSVEYLVIRARPQHMDVRFFNNKYPRFRMASSYIQNVVNEIVLRSNGKYGKAPQVIFEPGIKEFIYGNPTIRFIPSSGRSQQSSLFTRASTLGTSHFIKDASDDIKDALIEQDKDLDEISDLLGDISNIAKTIGDEAERSSSQLDRITDKVDHANDRLKNNNKRIQKML